MKLIVHSPTTSDNFAELARRVGAIHGEAVIAYIRKLPGSREEKLALLRGIYSCRSGAD